MGTKDDKRDHARALAELGASKGGKARATSLTPEERSQIARYAAEKRWESATAALPKETHAGVLKIGDKELPCSVLDNGTRVFSTRGLTRAVGGRATGTRKISLGGARKLPPFLTTASIKPFISEELTARLLSPIQYKPKHGGRSAFGYEATLLPQICEAILDAGTAGVLKTSQKHLAETAQLLIRGFARVGIIALVDEATGYQADRAKDDLMRILAAYISKELLPWTKRFPDEFFQQVYRLHGWQFVEGHHKRPQYVGQLINKLVYNKLPPGVLPELRRRNPTMPSGYRRYQHHRLLTEDIGHPHLSNQVATVTGLMRASDDKHEFLRLFTKAFPQKGQQLVLNLAEEEN